MLCCNTATIELYPALSWRCRLQALQYQLDVKDTDDKRQARQQWNALTVLRKVQHLDRRPVYIEEVLVKAPADHQCCRISELENIPVAVPSTKV